MMVQGIPAVAVKYTVVCVTEFIVHVPPVPHDAETPPGQQASPNVFFILTAIDSSLPVGDSTTVITLPGGAVVLSVEQLHV